MPPTPRAPELLAPAGSAAMMHSAFSFGADAIYAGQPRYSLRVRNNEFSTLEKLHLAIETAHRAGKAFYLVANVLPHNAKVRTFLDDLAPVVEASPDALIMADPGLIALALERWPQMPIHLSVQANTMNYAAVRFWRSIGIRRIILSRELSLDEIAEIRDECNDIELEVFVHGALCIAYSGRCLLSGYFNHRDANQGVCTNSCRWNYRYRPENENDATPINGLIEEGGRPGEWMPIEEDEHGTYILNSKDLRAVEHIGRLVEIGVDSLKIEGRTKSPYYVARTTQIYRKAIDDAVAGRRFDADLFAELEELANRGYTDGFYQRHHDDEKQNYQRGTSESAHGQYVGDAVRFDEARRLMAVEAKNRFATGDRLRIIHPDGNREIIIERIEALDGRTIDIVPGCGHRVFLDLPAEVEGALLARLS